MSFIGGVIGVALLLLILTRRVGVKTKELLVLGDIILCVVPLGIFLGRIGNFLNQELIGKPLVDL